LPSCRRIVLLTLVFLARGAFAAAPDASGPPPPDVDPAVLARIRDAAMGSNWAWEHLAALVDGVGPRLSGSPQLDIAIQRVSDAMRATGASVRLQPVKVPHWVRGAEQAQIVSWAGQAQGALQVLHVTALGNTPATPEDGIIADAIVVADIDELKRRGEEAKGRIVVFTARFDQRLADNGNAFDAYSQGGRNRFVGPAAAARLGAAAALVRSVGGAEFRLPHTGATFPPEGAAPIPAGALAAEDTDLIARLASRGNVRIKLLLTPRTLPEADSANVIADWPGREKPDEVVVVSGHLDSWDLGTGAIDDGAGAIASAAVIELMRALGLHPRRTIRFIAWTNEENGGRGHTAYFDSVTASISNHVAAIESDAGAGRSMGVIACVTADAMPRLAPLAKALVPLGAGIARRIDDDLGADIAPLQKAGVPGFIPLQDTRHYFDYHHTAADTLDKVDPESFRTQVATLAMLAYYLAEMPQPFARFAPTPK
jgi:carboxypeptidase Q